ncbi:hypothetical protein RAMLITH_15925 [Ramlibacter sp. RBP-2]|uniref:Uncharacterized protein n=1 Tax=Ramlibacter lithotrophicus TaxID=2606681 RepID=A0A7X6I7E8_9BURK|nr:hypothetical protein [Ramlibacter lithotrophicus]NKE67313.1 hypothetical protein [Ramlibacter lithotrophicus]
MLRELHEVVAELQDSVAPLAAAARAGMRVSAVEVDLPLDMALVLRGGGCTLLADVPRNLADASWNEEPNRLQFTLAATPAGQGEGA